MRESLVKSSDSSTFYNFEIQMILLKRNQLCDIFENIIEKKTGCSFRESPLVQIKEGDAYGRYK